MKLEYKNHIIEYEDWNKEKEGFYIQTPKSGPYLTLTKAKAEVDKLAKIKYIEEQVFYFERDHTISGAIHAKLSLLPEAFEITRAIASRPHDVDRESYRGKSFWIKKATGKGSPRAYETRSNLYLVCPENDRIIPQMVQASVEFCAAAEKLEKLYKELKRLESLKVVQ
jgi:hypothetical protein